MTYALKILCVFLVFLGSCSKNQKTPEIARHDMRTLEQDQALEEIGEFSYFSGSDIQFEKTPDGKAILIHCQEDFKRNEALKVLKVIDRAWEKVNIILIDIEPLSIEAALKVIREKMDTDQDFGASAVIKNGVFKLQAMGPREEVLKAKEIIQQAQQDVAPDG